MRVKMLPRVEAGLLKRRRRARCDANPVVSDTREGGQYTCLWLPCQVEMGSCKLVAHRWYLRQQPNGTSLRDQGHPEGRSSSGETVLLRLVLDILMPFLTGFSHSQSGHCRHVSTCRVLASVIRQHT